MKTTTRFLAAVLGSLACLAHGNAFADDIYDPLGLVSPGRGELVTIQAGFKFTEGPAVDRHGNVYFTDQPDDRIYRWDAGTRKVTLFLEGTGRANGMAFDEEGNLIEEGRYLPDGSEE